MIFFDINLKCISCVISALDLLEQLLRFNAGQRWSAERALQHDYLSEYRSGENEPTADICYNMEHEVCHSVSEENEPTADICYNMEHEVCHSVSEENEPTTDICYNMEHEVCHSVSV